jgi:ADP-ribose diphosphatase
VGTQSVYHCARINFFSRFALPTLQEGPREYLIEKDEDLLTAANRELQEEVGYGAKTLTHIATLTSTPGYSSSQSHVILAQDLYPAKLPGDEPEEIEVKTGNFAELPQLFSQHNFTEARSIAALYMARDYLLGRQKI